MTVWVVAGGSGGHVVPARAVARALSDSGRWTAVRLILDQRHPGIDDRTQPVKLLNWPRPSGGRLRRAGWYGWNALKASRRVAEWMRTERPAAVIGFGSYASVVPVWMAQQAGIPTLVHEQNVVPGRATRWLARRAQLVALSWEETLSYWNVSEPHQVVGNPTLVQGGTVDRETACQFWGLDPGRFTVVVTGGSQGARQLNELVPQAIGQLDGAVRPAVQVLHLAGALSEGSVRQQAAATQVPYTVTGWTDHMDQVYGAADVVIGRAGALTVSELAAWARPSILVPHPAAKIHQLANAQVLAERGAATMLVGDEANAERLKVILERLIRDQRQLRDMADAAGHRARSDPAAALCQLLDRIASGHAPNHTHREPSASHVAQCTAPGHHDVLQPTSVCVGGQHVGF